MNKYLCIIFLTIYTVLSAINYPNSNRTKAYSDTECVPVYKSPKLTIKVYKDLVGKLPEGFLDPYIKDHDYEEGQIIIWDIQDAEETNNSIKHPLYIYEQASVIT